MMIPPLVDSDEEPDEEPPPFVDLDLVLVLGN
jgi:hypothetical protein